MISLTLKNKSDIFSTAFPLLKYGIIEFQFVRHFKYIGHTLTTSLSEDNDIYDIYAYCICRTHKILGVDLISLFDLDAVNVFLSLLEKRCYYKCGLTGGLISLLCIFFVTSDK